MIDDVFALDSSRERPSELAMFGKRFQRASLKVCVCDHEVVVVDAQQNPYLILWI